MSLTRHLSQRSSPVLGFFKQHFANTEPIRKDFLYRLRDTPEPIRPSERVPYGTVGMAIDYRIRYYFAGAGQADLAAAHGWQSFAIGATVDEATARADLVEDFREGLARALTELDPSNRRLAPADEEVLCRYCYVLALFEELYRAGPTIESALWALSKSPTLDDLLSIASDVAIDDLCRLSWTFYDSHRRLVDSQVILNPAFAGSHDVGGADADIIMDRCLIEFKTALNPKEMSPKWPRWLYQLLGYSLLDYDDRYEVQEVGVYLVRQQTMMSWPLRELVETAASPAGRSLGEYRAEFRKLLTLRE